MRYLIRAAGFALALSTVAFARDARAQVDPQTVVDRATLAVQEMLTEGDAAARRDLANSMSRARAVMVCPRVLRAGFIIGGQGGDCVLAARDGAGSWSSPAFYTMGGGSFGLQVGVQDMQLVILIMTDRGLSAVMDSQFKFGADASVALATLGGGVGGATTAAAGADILTFARNRGLYLGISLDGSLLSARSDLNQGYYQRSVGARQIVVDMQAHNPASDPLRAALLRGAGAQQAAAAPSPGPATAQAPQSWSNPPVPAAPAGRVTREPLR
ncbi:lipid-binding SYLF domain-containing protein [Roseomonas sp. CCTCC AB2023176]|uniref:lipid-binding SYLF domain-containing protein n=1 Tax=Roseomonas sp. CCTCC AB2023176 TaxID=3342640 RepID=UPI0035D66F40